MTSDLGRTVRLTIPAKPEYITLSRLALAGLARVRPLADETLADLKLALTEACSNSVRHAYEDGEGHVDISFELRDDRLIVEVADDGTGFEPEPSGDARRGDAQRGRARDRDHPLDRRRGRDRRPSERQGVAPPLRQAALVCASDARTAEADRRLQPWSDLVRARPGGADREAGRRRPRHRARPARLPPRRHLDRERDLGRGPRSRGRGHGRGDGARRLALQAPARRASPGRVRPLLQRDREPGAVVRPARALGAQAPPRAPARACLGRRLRPGQRRLCRRGRRGARAGAGGRGPLPRLPPLRRAGARPPALPRRRAVPFHAHPLGRAGRLVGAAGADRAGDPRGTARVRRRRFPHAALASRVPRQLRRSRPRARRAACDRAPDLDRSRRVRRARGQRAGAGARTGARSRPARAADPARRPHRPVEERAARARGVRPAARAPSRPARPGRHARPARRIPPDDPGVRRGAGAHRSGGSRRRGALPRRAETPDRRRLSGVDRGVQAIRRPARERGHGWAEPRCEGGADREPTGRCRCLICKRRCVRGASSTGSFPSSRSTSPAPRTRSKTRWRSPRTSGIARRREIAAHVRSHDLEHWIAAQLADLDRASSIRRR